ncbi:hypothetical protein [Methylobacterium sp. SyP6R]|uniref:hypothetical protein n=1 Tax=Methylobacterium sp. SyP6R TaxID=2718876 RepID=UPI001F240D2E|nr:hypothetical protein [Methylobacterium sp. SyP6R]MCF4123821.1 hypothetical protein [Methylobacterium sp. SyP6R]
MMPRNPAEADWLIRSAEEQAAQAERWAAVAQQQAAYQAAIAQAHAADAAGLRSLWSFEAISVPRYANQAAQPAPVVVETRSVPEPAEPPTCEFCGKPTRIWNGKPQRFCSWIKTSTSYSCAQRFRERRNSEIRRKARAEAKSAAHAVVSCEEIKTIYEDDNEEEKPSCQFCGKITRIWRGRPQKFCPPSEGYKKSPCVAAFHNRAARAKPRRRTPRTQRLTKQTEPVRPSGSVLATASPRAAGHALLAAVTLAVPRHHPDDLRDEIISEAAMLAHQGVEINEAVVQATRSVRKNAAPLRYTKPIEDCFWLADEAQSGVDLDEQSYT